MSHFSLKYEIPRGARVGDERVEELEELHFQRIADCSESGDQEVQWEGGLPTDKWTD